MTIDQRRHTVIFHPLCGLTPAESAAWADAIDEMSEEDRPSAFDKLSGPRRGTGACVALEFGEHVGTLRTWDSFVTHVVGKLEPSTGISPAEFAVLADALPAAGFAALTSPILRIVLRAARAGSYALSGQPTWLWRNTARGTEPLRGLPPSHMPRRLGLPNFEAGRKYLALAVSGACLVDPRVPLIFDSYWEGLLFWHPGGHTLPISDGAPSSVACGPTDGLEEIVVYGATYGPVTDRVVWLVAD